MKTNIYIYIYIYIYTHTHGENNCKDQRLKTTFLRRLQHVFHVSKPSNLLPQREFKIFKDSTICRRLHLRLLQLSKHTFLVEIMDSPKSAYLLFGLRKSCSYFVELCPSFFFKDSYA